MVKFGLGLVRAREGLLCKSVVIRLVVRELSVVFSLSKVLSIESTFMTSSLRRRCGSVMMSPSLLLCYSPKTRIILRPPEGLTA